MESATNSISGSSKNSKNMIILSIFILLLIFPIVPLLVYKHLTTTTVVLEKKAAFEIEPGDSISQIAENLYERGLISSELAFKVYIKINKLEKGIQAGVYELPTKVSIEKLAELFKLGKKDIKLTYIEGWRVEQFAQKLVSVLPDINYTEFVRAAKPYEGYLFPDTYTINQDISQEEVLSLLRENFQEKTKKQLSASNIEKTELTKEQIVVLASIVEREVAKPDDRKIVAGILLRRFKEGMKIEADATTQYAIALKRHCQPNCRDTDDCSQSLQVIECQKGENLDYLKDINWWPNDLTQYELDSDNPYNTRKVMGLPPAPISSFGLNALDAVVNFKQSDYYFYLTDSSGKTHFAKTYDDHLANIAKYLSK